MSADLSPGQLRAFRTIPAILRRDVARTDVELARMTGLTHAELRHVIMVLYRQHVIDFRRRVRCRGSRCCAAQQGRAA
jgi:transcription initiation factor IIE alpha subunit